MRVHVCTYRGGTTRLDCFDIDWSISNHVEAEFAAAGFKGNHLLRWLGQVHGDDADGGERDQFSCDKQMRYASEGKN